MLKRFFKYRFHVRGLWNPFIWLKIYNFGEECCVNKTTKRDIPIIVSLTSYNDRFKKLPITLYSIFNQTLKPDRVILWLDEDSENLSTLPYNITKFIKNGLEIRFVKDIRSYTKAIYAFQEFSNNIIVTADDDIYYRNEWLQRLYLSYITHPDDIHVHRAHRVKFIKGKILPYARWHKHVFRESAGYNNFITGVGGVLYPPHCFNKEVLRKDIFLKYAPTADDIWFWVMALLNNRKIRVVKNHYKTLVVNSVSYQLYRKTLYSENKNGGNDEQLNNLMKFYGSNIVRKLQLK